MSTPALRLLVVDDDPMQLELIRRSLGYEGFDVETAASATAASAAIERFAPHVVLVDANIPDMSRADLEQLVRFARDHASVALFSAADGSKLRTLASEVGAHAWFSKSSPLSEIARQLERLHKSAAPREGRQA